MHKAAFPKPPPKLRQKPGKSPYEVKQQNPSKVEQGSKLLPYSSELRGNFRRVALASSRLIPPKPQSTTQTLYPLRGTPIRYENPTEPVAEDDWSALE